MKKSLQKKTDIDTLNSQKKIIIFRYYFLYFLHMLDSQAD